MDRYRETSLCLSLSLSLRHVWEHAILRRVRAREVCVVMATNAGWMLNEADRIAVIDKGACEVGARPPRARPTPLRPGSSRGVSFLREEEWSG
mgnify:FL=1